MLEAILESREDGAGKGGHSRKQQAEEQYEWMTAELGRQKKAKARLEWWPGCPCSVAADAQEPW